VPAEDASRPNPDVELQPVTEADEWLTVKLETDPRVMAELGGAWTDEQARATHARRLRTVRDTGSWWFKIVRRPDDAPVGSIVLWDSEWAGEPASEAGWMVLPEHQGKGYASEGLRLLLQRAAEGDRWGDIHASPGAENAPSNALCRKFGFTLLDVAEFSYRGATLRCNHWALDTPARPEALRRPRA
jgi:RimJ/RimL family protein N-acetyltransferase